MCRVLSRLKGIANHIKAPIFKDKLGWRLAKQIVEAGDGKNAGKVNQALMELGATYCSPSGTGVDIDDPLRNFWLSTRLGEKVGQIVISDTTDIDSFIAKAAIARGEAFCPLCDSNGINAFLTKCSSTLTKEKQIILPKEFEESSRMAGHATLPLSPPKKTKREEFLALVAFSSFIKDTNEERWLMVKRPNKGLLAGQWEFPSCCLESSLSKPSIAKIFDLDYRKKSISDMMSKFSFSLEEHRNTVMCEIWEEYNENAIALQPLEHLFSHIKHTMFVEYVDITSAQLPLRYDSYQTCDKREFRWMTTEEMKEIGITSGVNKVFNAIDNARSTKRRKKRKMLRD